MNRIILSISTRILSGETVTAIEIFGLICNDALQTLKKWAFALIVHYVAAW